MTTADPGEVLKEGGLDGDDVVRHGGIFVATYQIPEIGRNVVVKVSMPGGYEFEALGIVRWTRGGRRPSRWATTDSTRSRISAVAVARQHAQLRVAHLQVGEVAERSVELAIRFDVPVLVATDSCTRTLADEVVPTSSTLAGTARIRTTPPRSPGSPAPPAWRSPAAARSAARPGPAPSR